MSTEQLTPTKGLEANAGQGMKVNDLVAATTPPPSSAKGEIGEIETANATPKAPLKNVNVKTPAKATGNAGADNTPGSENAKSTPKRKSATPGKKGSAKKAKLSKDDGEEGEDETPTKSGKKARVAAYTLPKTAEDFDESERMIVDWRKANKTWAEIDIEYERLTNTKPGNATIRKRYPKLLAVATTFTPAEEKALLSAFKTADTAVKEKIKEVEASKWAKVAEILNVVKADDPYNKDALEKRFDIMVKAGRATTEGNWIEAEAEAAEVEVQESDDEGETEV